MERKTLIFNKSAIQSLMSLPEHIEICEKAFRLHGKGEILSPDLLHIDSDQGEFHVKAGGLRFPKTYFGLKCNGGFFQNKINFGLPNIQGLILLYDGDNGSPLAIFESGDITIKRTGAATAVAAKYLAKKDFEIITICGCGIQGKIQLESILQVRDIKKAYVYDIDNAVMKNFAGEMTNKFQVEVISVTDLAQAILESQVCITCTPSRDYFIKKEYAHEGLFIAAVGADSPEKHELAPALVASSKVITDITAQCVNVGEIHHAMEGELMKEEDVHGEIGEIITGKRQGRTSDKEIIIYDATGTALQDVAASAYIYEKALKENIGVEFEFTS